MTARSLARRYWGVAGQLLAARTAEHSRFETRAPSQQTAVDAVPDWWASRLPEPLTARAGETPLFADDQLSRGIEALGGVEGARVLELGPLEGGHSYMLESAGATVIGVEANKDAFLKCLVVKELLQLQRCSFLCGDAIQYLEETADRFDVCVASGILYHMVEPVRLIELVSQHADRLFIWTHYYSAEPIARNPHMRRRLDPTPTQAEHGGYPHQLHRHRYGIDTHLAGFWGGTQPFSNWLTRDGLLGALEHFGWRDVKLVDDIDHFYGPAVSLAALRD